MSDTKKLAIIASKGTLDWAYPPFILASTAAAMDMEAVVFFTFYGLPLLKKEIDAKVKDAEAHKSEDEARKALLEEKNHLDQMVYQVEKLLKDNGEKLPEADKKEAEEAIVEAKAALAKSKFAKMADFGKPTKGYICLQDHGNQIGRAHV